VEILYLIEDGDALHLLSHFLYLALLIIAASLLPLSRLIPLALRSHALQALVQRFVGHLRVLLQFLDLFPSLSHLGPLLPLLTL
jgi:hypothetical protein